MFIEDEELRSLYKDASSDHLNTLETGLLHLEKHPQDTDRIKALLRATHSLKGDSRMLGVKDAETLTHQMEEVLGTVVQGERTFSPDLFDDLYKGLDAVRKVVNAAITGQSSDVSTFHALAQLMRAGDTNEEADGNASPAMVDTASELELSLMASAVIKSPRSEGQPEERASELTLDELMAQMESPKLEGGGLPEEDLILETDLAQDWFDTGLEGDVSPSLQNSSISALDLSDLEAALDQHLEPPIEEEAAIASISESDTRLERRSLDGDGLTNRLAPADALLDMHELEEDAVASGPVMKALLDMGEAEDAIAPRPDSDETVIDISALEGDAIAPRSDSDETVIDISALEGDLSDPKTPPPDNRMETTGRQEQTLEFITALNDPIVEDWAGDSDPTVIKVRNGQPERSSKQTHHRNGHAEQSNPIHPEQTQHRNGHSEQRNHNHSKQGNPPPETIETVRVKAAKLDTLMTQAGELAVTQRRIGRRMGDIEAMLLLWEKWSQKALANRGQLERLQGTIEETAFAALQKQQQLGDDNLSQFGTLLKQLYSSANEDTAQLTSLSNDIESGILQLRQLPLSSLFAIFPRMIRDIGKQQGKAINFEMEGSETQADKRIIEEMKAPLNHLIRNAIDHGIEPPKERKTSGKSATATLTLKAYQQGNQIILEVRDDGRGLDLEKIKHTALRRGLHSEAELAQMSSERLQSLIFAPGFSTRSTVTELSGRGVGLDVVRVNVERLKGTIQVQSIPGQGCTFRFAFPTNVGSTRALILEVNQTPYAIPIEAIDRMMRVEPDEIFTMDGSPTITFDNHPVSVVWLRDLLNLPISAMTPAEALSPSSFLTCIILQMGSEQLGLFVDQLIDQQDIVVKSHCKLLKRVRNIAGATILGTGQVCMVLNPQDLVRAAQGNSEAFEGVEVAIAPPVEHRVLLVEDSLPIRTQVRRILQGAGYRVTTAVDGLDGLGQLEEGTFDAVVSDVEMPNLDGLGLTAKIRQQTKYGDLPIILVTTLAKDEDKRRGALAGANAYITKGDFDQSLLLQTLRRLI